MMDSDSSTMECLFPVDTPLTSSQLASILEAGLTLVLYQRGQIPLPYQQLEKSALQLRMEEEDREKENGLSPGMDGGWGQGRSWRGHAHGVAESSLSNDNETGVNPRARISVMMQERRKKVLLQRLEKQRKLGLAAESKAYNSIRPALEILESLLVDDVRTKEGLLLTPGEPRGIVTVALILGPSVYCPKEIYFFDLLIQQMPEDNTFSSKLQPEQFRNTILRQFYKKLITSPDLLDFTDRPLATTYSHLCLISSGELDFVSGKNGYYRNVVRLPSIPPSILNPLIASNSLFSGTESIECSNLVAPMISLFPRKAKSKCFRVKIQQNFMFEQRSIESTTTDMNSFSSDTLFDSNSFVCYQIPLRFKGVPCKNKRF